MLNFGLLWRAGLLLAGLWWCKEILGRWREDVAELKDPDTTKRVVILSLWGATAVVAGLMAVFIWGLAANIIHLF